MPDLILYEAPAVVPAVVMVGHTVAALVVVAIVVPRESSLLLDAARPSDAAKKDRLETEPWD